MRFYKGKHFPIFSGTVEQTVTFLSETVCSKDKKRESNTLNYIVCNEIGKAEIVKTTVDGFAALMEGK